MMNADSDKTKQEIIIELFGDRIKSFDQHKKRYENIIKELTPLVKHNFEIIENLTDYNGSGIIESQKYYYFLNDEKIDIKTDKKIGLNKYSFKTDNEFYISQTLKWAKYSTDRIERLILQARQKLNQVTKEIEICMEIISEYEKSYNETEQELPEEINENEKTIRKNAKIDDKEIEDRPTDWLKRLCKKYAKKYELETNKTVPKPIRKKIYYDIINIEGEETTFISVCQTLRNIGYKKKRSDY